MKLRRSVGWYLYEKHERNRVEFCFDVIGTIPSGLELFGRHEDDV